MSDQEKKPRGGEFRLINVPPKCTIRTVTHRKNIYKQNN